MTKFLIEVTLPGDPDPSEVLDRVIEVSGDEEAIVTTVADAPGGVTISNTFEVTDQNVEDMMATAAYGGITYWATNPTEADYDETDRLGATFTIKEADSGKVYHLTREDIRKAFARLVASDQQYVGDMVHGYFLAAIRDADEDGIDAGHIDSTAADVLVQVACFGKVIYG